MKTLIVMAVLFEALFGVTIAIRASEDRSLDSQLRKSLSGSEGNSAFTVGVATICVVGAIYFALTRNRRRKTVMAIVEDRMTFERARLLLSVEKRIEAERKGNEDWRNQQITEIYQMVLDQQARGLLPCPNCRHGEHRKSA